MSETSRRVVVVSGDPLPLPGLPTSGAGLRAWQLGQGLRSRGHDVTFLMPQRVIERFPDVALDGVATFRERELLEAVRRLEAEVVVLQHWPLVEQVAEGDIPIALDLHGPILLETAHNDRQHIRDLGLMKLRAFQRADFICCAGARQRAYFYAWMVMAGLDMRANAVAVIPVALSPAMPERLPSNEITFIYGGVFLPWQDPTIGLTTLVETLDARGQGRLQLFAGPHPIQSISSGAYTALVARLGASPRVERPGLLPHAQMVAAYRSATVAFDLMAPNPERELAFTTRTVEYLWCGLPVIYNNYAELADYISAYNAGWTVDPRDPVAIRAVIESVLDSPEQAAERGRNAQRLIRERLNWEIAIEPLDRFCRHPRRRDPADTDASIGSINTSLIDRLRKQDRFIAHLTDEIERKNRHIAELEALIERMQNGRVMRLLRRLGRS